MIPSPNPGEFRVPISAAIAQKMRDMSDEAALDGQTDAFISALKYIDEKLRNDPTAFGEDIVNFRTHRGTIKLAIRLPIALEFGVYLDQKLVIIRSLTYMAPGQ